MTVSPSLLSCDFLNIEKEITFFKGIENLWFHLDIMDGHFVPNLSFGHPVVKKICRISPHKIDAHLMVTNPEFYIDTFKDYKIHNLTFHLEVCSDLKKMVNMAKKHYSSVGISIRPDTKIERIPRDILPSIDLLLVMSVMPGFGGQKFMEETYERLEHIVKLKRELNASFQIQVDGGVSGENAEKLIDQGVDNLVAGSYIFNAPCKDYIRQVETLREF